MQAPNAIDIEASSMLQGEGRLALALSRLERSRSQLLVSLARNTKATDRPAGSHFNPLDRARAWLRASAWGDVLDPLADALCQSLTEWWHRQSWRESAIQAKNALAAELSPLVQRHPIAAMAVTAIAGAALVGSGVWRWRTVRRTGLQLALRLRRAVVGQLGSPAVQSMLLGALLTYLAGRRKPAQANAAAEPAPAPAAAAAAAAAAGS